MSINFNFNNSYKLNKELMRNVIDNMFTNFDDYELVVRFNCYMHLYININHLTYKFKDDYKFTDEDIEKLIDIVMDIGDIDEIPSYINIDNIADAISFFIDDAKSYVKGELDKVDFINLLIRYLSGLFYFEI